MGVEGRVVQWGFEGQMKRERPRGRHEPIFCWIFSRFFFCVLLLLLLLLLLSLLSLFSSVSSGKKKFLIELHRIKGPLLFVE